MMQMENSYILAVIIAGIASVIEVAGSWALLAGKISANPHAVIMTISGIAAMWVAIILALGSSKAGGPYSSHMINKRPRI